MTEFSYLVDCGQCSWAFGSGSLSVGTVLLPCSFSPMDGDGLSVVGAEVHGGGAAGSAEGDIGKSVENVSK